MDNVDLIKKKLGASAADLIQDGMMVGLGSGSTAAYFIDSLIKRCQEGLKITVVSSSKGSLDQAKKGKIKTYDLNQVNSIDITVDGADEIDLQKRMIKGGGGFHVKEKILAFNSTEMVVMVDYTKLVSKLGKRKLPVEVFHFGYLFTEKKLNHLGFEGTFRKNKEGSLYITENNNLLYDISFKEPLDHPEQVHEQIIHVTGVIDTGFFFNVAGRVLVGHSDGKIQMIP